MKRLYDARPSNIRSFMDRMKLLVSELDLPNVNIQQKNLFLFQLWNTPRCHYINPFANYSKSTVAPVVFQRVFASHRGQYSSYSTIYTDGSKRADYIGCGVVIEDIIHGYRLDTSCSVFTAEPAPFAVHFNESTPICPSTVQQGFRYRFLLATESRRNHRQRASGQRGKVGDDPSATSSSLSDMKHVILHHIFKIWQESWTQQLDNKLHSVKPAIGAWPVMLMRRTDVKLTRLRIGHTRFTHRHLLLGKLLLNVLHARYLTLCVTF
ncbi:RNase H domain-containing protein [Trichonephila clavipes]|nr:RNase H domain-containing protein [Trichonephila clavipes]